MASVDIRSLDIGMLRAFDALLTERSVSRAASRLFLSQPAVSSSLKRLREVFGDPLFTRTAHGVEPTPRAHALAPHVHAVLSEVARLLVAGSEFDPTLSDRVFRMVGSDNMSRLILPPLCSLLTRLGSGIRIFWEAANYAALGERLQRGDADFGLLPRASSPANLSSELLYEDSYVLVARRGRFNAPVSMETFCSAPHVFLGYGRSALDDTIDQILARAGHRRHTQVAVTSFDQMADILVRSEHVSVFPARAAAQYGDALESFSLPFELPRYGMYLCWSHRVDDDPGIGWLKTEVVKIARTGAQADADLVRS
jgi:DNA-binding transcriptional LysR family regulator